YWIRIAQAGGVFELIPDTLACSRLYPETKTLSARYHIFQEIFRICHDHLGEVDRGHFHGLWHHLCWERDRGLARWLRWLPNFDKHMAALHCRWWHRQR